MAAPNSSLLLPRLQLLLLLSLHLLRQTCGACRGMSYSQQTVCSGMVLSSSHRYQTRQARSLIVCISRCQADVNCLSVVHEPGSGLCHLGNTVAWQSCSNMEPAAAGGQKRRHYEKRTQAACIHEGIMQEGRCVCTEPYFGEKCEQVMRDCSDTLYPPDFDGNKLIVRTIYPTSAPAPFPVLCQVIKGRTYLMRNMQSVLNFNRSMNEYVHGFGNVNNDHWLGLEYVHYITQTDRRYKMRFEMLLTDGSTVYPFHSNFTLSGDAEGYTFSYSAEDVSGKRVNDCLNPLMGAAFSTYDNDRDDVDINCAQRHGFGWWFKGENCSSVCLPMGKPSVEGDSRSGDYSEAFWSTKDGPLGIVTIYGYLERI